ncbi:hypothetical protein [Mucilaginibacter psychrotolerans]|uniref:Lipocalin-like domain-containing protein n=1 Tax=Mucilaginibacter psychrotolerans TaxID=1524096 RepID=A0A4Y8SJL2_9SPHI|nr:hypothetical protein [Mucilaginibacter psychrotolerans]TFF38861.1 hypothetical protein E2R66_07605 [Mucilaginibacter psychrotolerans]
MKTLAKLSACIIILFAAACTKMQEVVLINQPLTGTWKLNATYMDPGDGSGTYHPVTAAGNNSITLKTNGELEISGLDDTENFLLHFSQYKSFTIQDSVTLVFKEHANNNTQKFIYKIEGDKLSLIPAGPVMCIEGCGVRFVKVN